MESHTIISYDESKAIILDFFDVGFDFDQLLKRHQYKKNPILIVSHVKEVIRKLILSIQNQLMLVSKIDKMLFSQNNTEQLFNQLMNLKDVLDEEEIHDFLIYYKNSIYKGTSYQTDLIPSLKRLSIYKSFVKYATEKDLFRFYVEEKPYEIQELAKQPNDLYPRQALEMIYKLYDVEGGNLKNLQKRLQKQANCVGPRYCGEQLKKNLKNLMLIGLFKVYKKSIKSTEKSKKNWESFLKNYLSTFEQFESYWKKVLLKIAIFDNPKMEEVKQITMMIHKKIDKKHQYVRLRIPKAEQDKKQEKEHFMRTLKSQLLMMMKN